MKSVLGIDPGLDGSLAHLWEEEGTFKISVFDLPKMKAEAKGNEVNWPEIAVWLDHTVGQIGVGQAVIEKVSIMPKWGRSSCFKFGIAAGGIRGMVAAHKIPITMVLPTVWKRHYGLSRAKDAARARASALFPKQSELFVRVKDDGRAEAALIALYGYRTIYGGG